MDWSGYVFILTVIDLQVATPYDIIPGYTLKKATTDQIEHIKSNLDRFDPYFPHAPKRLYEFDVFETQTDEPSQTRTKYKPLLPDDWRYWIISFEGTNEEVEDLGYSLSVMDQDVDFAFTVLEQDSQASGIIWHPQALSTHLSDPARRQIYPKTVLEEDLRLASDCYALIKSLEDEYKHIRRAFLRFDQLRMIPISSDLIILGLFSIIESLLTHDPKPTDPTDSLSRQIKKKILLLQKRFVRSLDYEKYFKKVKEQPLWSKLYAYRSLIAHGDSTDFTDNFQVLKDKKNVYSFLKEVVKLLLIESSHEPELLADLKEC